MRTKDLYAVIVGASLLVAGIQPAHAIVIPGDDSYYTVEGSTYTLNQDIYGTINIVIDGITLDGGVYTVTGTGAGYGVFVVGMDDVTIQNLTITNFASSGYSGIFLGSCQRFRVIDNDISNNYWGIELGYDCGGGTVTGNDISNNAGGIWLDAASNGNIVEGNTVSDNGASGIYIRDSSNNIVKNNTSERNGVGIRLNKDDLTPSIPAPTNNEIYNNNFIDNTIQADFYVDWVGSASNVFNLALPTGGNYWNTWISPDSDGDGFVDNPYPIYEYGTSTNPLAQDNFPWTVEDGWLTPSPTPVDIDIKPGSYPNSINLGSHGVVPVAIFSTETFDATALDANKIYLAGSGVRVRGKGNNYLASEEDVDGDGLLDLVVHIETENLEEDQIDGGAYLSVHISDDPFSTILYEGWDEVTIVPPQ